MRRTLYVDLASIASNQFISRLNLSIWTYSHCTMIIWSLRNYCKIQGYGVLYTTTSVARRLWRHNHGHNQATVLQWYKTQIKPLLWLDIHSQYIISIQQKSINTSIRRYIKSLTRINVIFSAEFAVLSHESNALKDVLQARRQHKTGERLVL